MNKKEIVTYNSINDSNEALDDIRDAVFFTPFSEDEEKEEVKFQISRIERNLKEIKKSL